MLGGEPDRDVATPRVSGEHRACDAELLVYGGQVGGEGGRVVAGVRVVGGAVAARVGRVRRVAGSGEAAADLVPHQGVRGQAVHQHERHAAAGRPVPHAQPDPAGSGHGQVRGGHGLFHMRHSRALRVGGGGWTRTGP
jgi:hypothetical protein